MSRATQIRSLLFLGILLASWLSFPAPAATAQDTEAGQVANVWNLGTLESGGQFTSSITAVNRSCPGRHDFEIRIQGQAELFLELLGPRVLKRIREGRSKTSEVRIDLEGLAPGTYDDGRVVIRCLDCPPVCEQDHEVVEIRLEVVGGAGAGTGTTGREQDAEEPCSEPCTCGFSLLWPTDRCRCDAEVCDDGEPAPAQDRPPLAPDGEDEGGEDEGEQEEDVDDEDAEEELCSMPPARKHQVYSRGNNNYDQLKEQKAKTGDHQYKTASFDSRYELRAERCRCVEGECRGRMELTATLEIADLPARYVGEPPKYRLLCGPPPSEATRHDGGGPPKPNVTVHIDEVDLPAAPRSGRFVAKAGAANVFTANAACEVPCSPGSYPRRFYVVHRAVPGTADVVPGRSRNVELAMFLDVTVEVEAPSACVLRSELEAFLLEFRPNFDFDHGTEVPPLTGSADELPKIVHEGEVEGETRNIAKLIAEDGAKVDDAFAPRAP